MLAKLIFYSLLTQFKLHLPIPIPDTAFYILITIVVALSSFFVCMIVANAEILHSGLIWKAVIGCILMVVLGIGIAVIIQKFSDRDK